MQTIGERLEEARKRKGISIREAAEATKIRGDYLHKFESNQFDIRLPEIYVRGFLRSYAVYLKLPGDKIINSYTALGLSDDKNVRPINREIYGRMDLSVASAEKETPAPAAPSSASEGGSIGAESSASQDGNPATFRPRPAAGSGGKGFAIDPNLVIKIGALAAGGIILILLLIWGIGLLTKTKSHTDSPLDTQSNITWVKPTDGQRVLSIVASGPVSLVTLTDSNNTVLYRGPLQAGQTVSVPRTSVITILSDQPQNFGVQITPGGTVYPLKDSTTGKFMNQSTVKAP